MLVTSQSSGSHASRRVVAAADDAFAAAAFSRQRQKQQWQLWTVQASTYCVGGPPMAAEFVRAGRQLAGRSWAPTPPAGQLGLTCVCRVYTRLQVTVQWFLSALHPWCFLQAGCCCFLCTAVVPSAVLVACPFPPISCLLPVQSACKTVVIKVLCWSAGLGWWYSRHRPLGQPPSS